MIVVQSESDDNAIKTLSNVALYMLHFKRKKIRALWRYESEQSSDEKVV